jgi:DNA replication protein DnaC
LGWVIETRDGREVAVPCACRRERLLGAFLRGSQIPARYGECSTENFLLWQTDRGKRWYLEKARDATRAFIDTWPRVDKGLLFVGDTGTGKTHLAVAALHELIATKGVAGLYVNFTELVQALQMSFDGGSRTREEIITPVIEAELLVLDELGAAKPTPWVMDLLYYVINARYMQRRVTICTSNRRDVREESGDEGMLRSEDSLADRISAPVRSRLFEMCEVVELKGDDFRARVLARTREH